MAPASHRLNRRTERVIRPAAWWPALAVSGALAAGLLFLTPGERTVERQLPATATIAFDYTTPAAPSPVYDEGGPAFGDPVFRAVADEVEVLADYRLTTADLAVTDGRFEARVVVSSSAGWSRTLGVEPAVSFDGPRASVSVPVRFADVEALAARIDGLTGATGSLAVRIEVTATSILRAAAEPRPVFHDSRTTSHLTFDLSEHVARPDRRAGSGTTSTTELIAVPRSEPATLSLGLFDVGVGTARRVVLPATFAALAIALRNARVTARARRRGEATLLETLHGPELVRVRCVPPELEQRAVDVDDFDSLRAAAENATTEILHLAGEPGGSFFVVDGGLVLRYRPSPPATPADADPSDRPPRRWLPLAVGTGIADGGRRSAWYPPSWARRRRPRGRVGTLVATTALALVVSSVGLTASAALLAVPPSRAEQLVLALADPPVIDEAASGPTTDGLSLTFSGPAGPVTGYEYSTDAGLTWRSTGSSTSPLLLDTRSDGGPFEAGADYPVLLAALDGLGRGRPSTLWVVTFPPEES
jgi:hypothetical protein